MTASLEPSLVDQGRVVLTPLSPLTDRNKLAYSPAFEGVASGLQSFGFSVGWDRGYLNVSPTRTTRRPANAPTTLSLDTFLGDLSKSCSVTAGGALPALACSFLTFTKTRPNAKLTQSLDGPLLDQPGCWLQRPSTAQSPAPPSNGPFVFHQARTCSSGGNAKRFARLANSRKTAEQLCSNNVGMASSNLAVLAQPASSSSWQGPSKPEAPTLLPIPDEPPAPPVEDLPSPHLASMGLGPHTGPEHARPATCPPMRPPHSSHGLNGSLRETSFPSAAGWGGRTLGPPAQPPLRPLTPQTIQLHDTALSALRPLTPQPGHALSPSRPLAVNSSLRQPNAFKATRGQALIVFQLMDKDENGKLTLSELEEAAISLGFTLEQAHTLFKRLDKNQRGYVVAADWGSGDMAKVVQLFTLNYMQRNMGFPGPATQPDVAKKFWQQQKLRQCHTVPAAIARARTNAIIRASHSTSGSGNIIFEAFRFIDTDNSNSLSFDEMRDGFCALGVALDDTVLFDIVKAFDKNGDGVVNIHEFCVTMFGTHARV